MCIDFKWRIPKDNGGSPITGYILERQQIGRNSWKKLGNVGTGPKYRDTDVDHGRKYCYHIWAETDQGISEMMETDDIQAGTKGRYTDELGFLFFVFFQHSVYSCNLFPQHSLEPHLHQRLLVLSKTVLIWLGQHPLTQEGLIF